MQHEDPGGIRTGYADGLIARAADVRLKERRRLVLVPRETPLSDVHLENMLALSRMGATISPPVPAFYNHPESLADAVDHLVVRILDQFGISAPDAKRWSGLDTTRSATRPPPDDHDPQGVTVPMAFVSIREGRPPEKHPQDDQRCDRGDRGIARCAAVEHPGRRHQVPMTHWATGDVTLAEKQEQDAAAAGGKAGSWRYVHDAPFPGGAPTATGLQVHDLRSALELLKQVPGQYHETDHPCSRSPSSRASTRRSAQADVQRPTKLGPAMMFNEGGRLPRLARPRRADGQP